MEGVGFSSEVVAQVRYILSTAAWSDFFVPSLNNIKSSWIDALVDPSKRRQDEYTDDYLRGCIATINALIDLPEALVAAADAQAEQQSGAEADDARFADRAGLGLP